MEHFSELGLSTQSAYAELFDAARAAELSRSVADISGSFARKKVKGNDYWYFQYTDLSGTLRQIYVGPDSESMRGLIGQARQPRADRVAALSRAAIALGCTGLLPRHYRVVRRLSEYGFFKAGGVLIGTHAFLSYGNTFGVRWGDSSRTQDVDFARAGKSLSIALPANIEVDTHGALESLGMGLLPVASLASRVGATYLNPKDPEFRIDFVTTRGRSGDEPYEHPQLRVTLQPLKFIEYSLEHIQQAALLGNDGAVIVNVPHPARFALHKLIVFGEREGAFVAKSSKDLAQAAALLAYLKMHRPWEVEEAWRDLTNRGRGWVQRINRGIAALGHTAPDIEMAQWLPSTTKVRGRGDDTPRRSRR